MRHVSRALLAVYDDQNPYVLTASCCTWALLRYRGGKLDDVTVVVAWVVADGGDS